MNDPRLRARYGLKYDPFSPDVPAEDIWAPPGFDLFALRIEHLAREGGFASVDGPNGAGKSKALQLLDARLRRIPDLAVGVMTRPQSATGDFYRELGQIFGVDLSPANRYGGFKSLRERWHEHLKNTFFHPVLLIDEAQITPTESLTELRLLASANFDSESLISAVLCGDHTLPHRFRHDSLTALGSRVRTRLNLGARSADDLRLFLDHLLDAAGAPGGRDEAAGEADAPRPRLPPTQAAPQHRTIP